MTRLKQTGLSDFGGTTFHEPFEILLQSLRDEAQLNARGVFMLHRTMLRLLTNRLRTEQAFADSPALAETPIRGRCTSLDFRARARLCCTICSHAIQRRVGCAFGKASIRRRHRNRWRMIPALPRWRNGRLVSRRSPRDWQPPTNWPRAGRRNVSGSSNIPSTILSSSYAPMCPPTRAGWPSTRRMSTFINITAANSNCSAPIAVAIIGCSRRRGIYPVWPVCSPSFRGAHRANPSRSRRRAALALQSV